MQAYLAIKMMIFLAILNHMGYSNVVAKQTKTGALNQKAGLKSALPILLRMSDNQIIFGWSARKHQYLKQQIICFWLHQQAVLAICGRPVLWIHCEAEKTWERP